MQRRALANNDQRATSNEQRTTNNGHSRGRLCHTGKVNGHSRGRLCYTGKGKATAEFEFEGEVEFDSGGAAALLCTGGGECL